MFIYPEIPAAAEGENGEEADPTATHNISSTEAYLRSIGFTDSDFEPANITIGSICGIVVVTVTAALFLAADMAAIRAFFRQLLKSTPCSTVGQSGGGRE